MDAQRKQAAEIEQEADIAIAQLRLFIANYEDEPPPDSLIAEQLDAARRAVAAYDAVQAKLGNNPS